MSSALANFTPRDYRNRHASDESPPQPPLTKSQLTGCQGDEDQLLMRVVNAESQQLTNEKRIHWADRVELQADRAGAIRGAPLKASAVQKMNGTSSADS
jgi:hypothetical protein